MASSRNRSDASAASASMMPSEKAGCPRTAWPTHSTMACSARPPPRARYSSVSRHTTRAVRDMAARAAWLTSSSGRSSAATRAAAMAMNPSEIAPWRLSSTSMARSGNSAQVVSAAWHELLYAMLKLLERETCSTAWAPARRQARNASRYWPMDGADVVGTTFSTRMRRYNSVGVRSMPSRYLSAPIVMASGTTLMPRRSAASCGTWATLSVTTATRPMDWRKSIGGDASSVAECVDVGGWVGVGRLLVESVGA
jgi:hypothetical protein